MRMKSKWRLPCDTWCGRCHEGAVFNVGFREPVSIRLQGDFSHPHDRAFVVSDQFPFDVRKAKVRGCESLGLSDF
jgi:hypothetical protein